jgi:hypothetical protein
MLRHVYGTNNKVSPEGRATDPLCAAVCAAPGALAAKVKNAAIAHRCTGRGSTKTNNAILRLFLVSMVLVVLPVFIAAGMCCLVNDAASADRSNPAGQEQPRSAPPRHIPDPARATARGSNRPDSFALGEHARQATSSLDVGSRPAGLDRSGERRCHAAKIDRAEHDRAWNRPSDEAEFRRLAQGRTGAADSLARGAGSARPESRSRR